MVNPRGYRAIVREAKRVGWPIAYQTDLTKHDRNTLSKPAAPREFGWVLREHGTHLFYRPCEGLDLDWAGLISAGLISCCTMSHFYWYDGEELHQVTPEVWFARLSCCEEDL